MPIKVRGNMSVELVGIGGGVCPMIVGGGVYSRVVGGGVCPRALVLQSLPNERAI